MRKDYALKANTKMPSYEGLDDVWYVKTILSSNSYIKWFEKDVLYFYKVKKLKNKSNGIFFLG